MLKKSLPIVPPPQAFTATTTRTPNSTESLSQDPCKALNQLASQLGFNPQPTTQQPQAFFTSHSQNNQIRGRTTKNHGRGRARFSSNRATIEQLIGHQIKIRFMNHVIVAILVTFHLIALTGIRYHVNQTTTLC